MEVPNHALNTRNRQQNFDAYVKNHPDTTVFSLSCIYESVWRFFAKENGLRCLPPPLIINHTRNYPRDDEYYSAAMFNTGYARVVYGDYYGLSDVPKTVFSHIYEIQFYTKAFYRRINSMCGRKCIDDVPIIEIAHLIFHELFHFLDHMNMSVALMDAYDSDPDTMRKFISEYLNKDRDITGKNEQYTEQRAFALLQQYVHSQFEDDLHLVFGGPAYQFMYARGKYAHYLSAIAFFECIKLDNALTYQNLSAEELELLADNASQAVTDMSNIHQQLTGNKRLRFVIID